MHRFLVFKLTSGGLVTASESTVIRYATPKSGTVAAFQILPIKACAAYSQRTRISISRSHQRRYRITFCRILRASHAQKSHCSSRAGRKETKLVQFNSNTHLDSNNDIICTLYCISIK